jgi:hypothetical protein
MGRRPHADAMSTPPPPGLLLFVSGEPGPPEDLSEGVVTSFWARLVGTVIPANWRTHGTQAPPRPPPGPDWHVPRAEIMSVNLVFEVVREAGRTVTLVNVNQPSDHQPLVARWIGPDDILPVLVRPDGARLAGIEEFEPGAVRKFLQNA